MRFIRQFFSIFVLFICVGHQAVPPAFAAKYDVNFYLNLLPHRQTGESSTQYDAVRDYLLNGVIDSSQFRFAPIKRSRQSFFQDPNSCLFPTNVTAIQEQAKGKGLKFLSSLPFDVVSFRLYTAKKTLKEAPLDHFKPSRVGYIRGTAALPLLGEKAARFTPIASEKQLIRMLELNRLDAFLGHHPDTDLALDVFNKSGSLFVREAAIANLRFPISIVCHKSDQAGALIKQLNPLILKLHQSGLLRKMLGTHADIPDLKGF